MLQYIRQQIPCLYFQNGNSINLGNINNWKHSKTEGIFSRETHFLLINNKLYVYRIIYSNKTTSWKFKTLCTFYNNGGMMSNSSCRQTNTNMTTKEWKWMLFFKTKYGRDSCYEDDDDEDDDMMMMTMTTTKTKMMLVMMTMKRPRT